MSRREHAVRLAVAISTTTDRYRRGYIVRSTWRTHVTHLWAKVDQSRLRPKVTELLRLS